MTTSLSTEEKKQFKQKIIDTLLAEPVFDGFKYVFKSQGLVNKSKTGFKRVGLYFRWDGYDLNSKEMAIEVTVGYSIRYEILHKWWEKFCFRELKLQREDGTVFGTPSRVLPELSVPDEYTFLWSGKDFDEKLTTLRNDVVLGAKTFFDKYGSLENVYNEIIPPILTRGEEVLPDVGSDWIFEYLALTKIVSPDHYFAVKQIIFRKIEQMNTRKFPDPNLVMYNNRLDEILEYIENFDFL